MNKTVIKAEVVADSLSIKGDRLTSLRITFPRIILAEINTHRMLSSNTSSSRAILFKKMVEAVQNPFIPIAWQKHHSGMQGTEYLSKTDKFNLISFMGIMIDTLHRMIEDSEEYDKLAKELDEKLEIIETLLTQYTTMTKTLDEWWLFARDKAVEAASIMYVFGVTKQLCNRLLEPFMWTTMLITGSKEGWDNFFRLRCPDYQNLSSYGMQHYKSKKEFLRNIGLPSTLEDYAHYTDLDWLQINKGQAEIHMMALAEAIYDAMNESTPEQLSEGMWHIPYMGNIDSSKLKSTRGKDVTKEMVKISTAMAARESYTVVGNEKNIDYQKQIDLHDKLISQDPPHSSCLKHCNRAMTDEEYESFIKGNVDIGFDIPKEAQGWCTNIKGFIPYRYMIDNNLKM